MLRRFVALGLCLVLLPSCGTGTAATIDRETVSIDALHRELDVMLANPDYTIYVARQAERRIVREGGFIPEIIAEVLTFILTSIVLEREVERRNARLTATDRAEAELEASANAGAPLIFARFPQWYREEMIDRATVRVALRRLLVEGITPESYYAENKEDFRRSCSRHILVGSRGEAERARDRIRQGQSFAQVAHDSSIDTGTAPKGGDLGCNSRGHLVGPLDDAAYSQVVGVVGEPIKTKQGFHLLLVERREIPPLDQIRGRVRGAIARTGKQRLERLATRRLRAADVTVNEEIGRWDGDEVRAR